MSGRWRLPAERGFLRSAPLQGAGGSAQRKATGASRRLVHFTRAGWRAPHGQGAVRTTTFRAPGHHGRRRLSGLLGPAPVRVNIECELSAPIKPDEGSAGNDRGRVRAPTGPRLLRPSLRPPTRRRSCTRHRDSASHYLAMHFAVSRLATKVTRLMTYTNMRTSKSTNQEVGGWARYVHWKVVVAVVLRSATMPTTEPPTKATVPNTRLTLSSQHATGTTRRTFASFMVALPP